MSETDEIKERVRARLDAFSYDDWIMSVGEPIDRLDLRMLAAEAAGIVWEVVEPHLARLSHERPEE